MIGIIDFLRPNLCSKINPLVVIKTNWAKVIMFPLPGWALWQKKNMKKGIESDQKRVQIIRGQHFQKEHIATAAQKYYKNVEWDSHRHLSDLIFYFVSIWAKRKFHVVALFCFYKFLIWNKNCFLSTNYCFAHICNDTRFQPSKFKLTWHLCVE